MRALPNARTRDSGPTSPAQGDPTGPARTDEPALPGPEPSLSAAEHARPGPAPVRGPAGPIRVALVDDHHVVRDGLRLVLAGVPGFEVVGDAGSEADALELVEATRPDVLLLDLTLADEDGIRLLREVRSQFSDVRIVVLTMHRDSETVRQALAAGAAGYLVKGAESHDLFEAIRAVWRGERYLHSSVTGAVVDDSIRWLKAGGGLSLREREILGLIASGHSPAEAAWRLGISLHTVRRHIANASDKLGIHGVSGLTRYAIENGLIRPE
ncbi:MAG: two-component system, NarL family, response regulator NreC [Chloroflexota bacterium]|nr:two-component system, NarL family, response regulator NreC [Chloroflexota bacterium]